jgi:NAD-dependent SIR2 family protein deacetylase
MTDLAYNAPMALTPDNEELLDEAAAAVAAAHALIITAGAGMGVDSGLPDFRGNQGFWNAYPPYAKLGLSFAQMANPRWFHADPEMAWGFYGHRLGLYRRTVPHAGFGVLRAWAERAPGGHFVFTSNVDGQFQRAGFDAERVVECHGAIDHAQCIASCGVGIYPADRYQVEVDPGSFRASRPLPACPSCGGLARPNILMFGDGGWEESRSEAQYARLRAWRAGLPAGARVVVIECGAGTAVPSVRAFGEEQLSQHPGTRMVRINVREPDVTRGHIGLSMGALEALTAIDARVRR